MYIHHHPSTTTTTTTMSLRNRLKHQLKQTLQQPTPPTLTPSSSPSPSTSPQAITDLQSALPFKLPSLAESLVNPYLHTIHAPTHISTSQSAASNRSSRTLLQHLTHQAQNTILRQTVPEYKFQPYGSQLQSSLFHTLIYHLLHAPHSSSALAAPQLGVPARVIVVKFVDGWMDDGRGVDVMRQLVDTVTPAVTPASSRNTKTTKPSLFRPTICINPRITNQTRTTNTMHAEGCLSIPEWMTEQLARPSAISVTYTTVGGDEVERTLSGFDARVFMHEVDHLDGRLYIDYLKYDRQLKPFPLPAPTQSQHQSRRQPSIAL